jgi:hypothetical protein
VLFDRLVDFLHQADRLADRDDDLLVVGDVVLPQRTTLAVFEPLLADLVAANVEVPGRFSGGGAEPPKVRNTLNADVPLRSSN